MTDFIQEFSKKIVIKKRDELFSIFQPINNP